MTASPRPAPWVHRQKAVSGINYFIPAASTSMPAFAAAEPCARSIVAQKSGGNLRPAGPGQPRIFPMRRRESPALRWKTRGYAVKTAIIRTFSLDFEKYRMEYVE
jgi:hypothetical protein